MWCEGRTVKSLHSVVKGVRQSFVCFSSISNGNIPHVPDLAAVRRSNAVTLFQRFAEDRMRAGVPPKGLEQAFAELLQVSPSMWSQLKSSRAIGDKLARQIEAACREKHGWLDEERAGAGLTPGEHRFLTLALKAWRATNADGRKRLKDAVKETAKRA